MAIGYDGKMMCNSSGVDFDSMWGYFFNDDCYDPEKSLRENYNTFKNKWKWGKVEKLIQGNNGFLFNADGDSKGYRYFVECEIDEFEPDIIILDVDDILEDKETFERFLVLSKEVDGVSIVRDYNVEKILYKNIKREYNIIKR